MTYPHGGSGLVTHLNASPLIEQFGRWEDPRIERTKLHRLQAIIIMSVCAVKCGADNWVEVADFCHAKREWWDHMRNRAQGIPSPDTFGRACARRDAQALEDCFLPWVQDQTEGQVIAIDGKGLRRSPGALGHGRVSRAPSTWSVSGRRPTGWCWHNRRWTPSPTNSLPSSAQEIPMSTEESRP